jgi:hypothetical protein
VESAPPLEIDQDSIETVVDRLYGRPVAIASWHPTPIRGQNLGLSGGLFRITGAEIDGGTWSVILKILRTVPATFLARFAESDRERLADGYLWDREAWLCESGLVDALPDGIRAARWLGLQRTADTCRLWFEDLGDNSAQWDAARYALAARHLGRLNGSFLRGRPLPEAPWVGRGWIRSWVTDGIGALQARVLDNDQIWEHELVRSAFAPDARARLRRVWGERDAILARLDALPQTFCHMDAFRPNLFDRTGVNGERETVAIDWSYVGIGPIGAEVGQLVLASTAYADRTHSAEALAPGVLPEYVAGLRDAGWRGDERDTQTGYALSAIRWVFMLGQLTAVTDTKRQEQIAQWAGLSYAEIVAEAGKRTEHLLRLLESGFS